MKLETIILLASASLAFGQTKISQLPPGNTVTGEEVLPMVQSGVTVQIAVKSLASGIQYSNVAGIPTPVQFTLTSITNSATTTLIPVSTNVAGNITTYTVKLVTTNQTPACFSTVNNPTNGNALRYTNGNFYWSN